MIVHHYTDEAKKLTLSQFKKLFESHLPWTHMNREEREDALSKEWTQVTGKHDNPKVKRVSSND